LLYIERRWGRRNYAQFLLRALLPMVVHLVIALAIWR
jgi:hypothetical protein